MREDSVEMTQRAEEAYLDDVPFGRNRLLRGLAAGVVGFTVARLTRAEPARAQHQATEWPCYDFRRCHYCDQQICYAYCYPYDPNRWLGCDSGWACWDVVSGGRVYRCCDHLEQFPGQSQPHPCICRGVGTLVT